MTKINRIVLSGGGTGGHIYPALSVYKELKRRNPDLEALYIGTQKGLEARIIPQEGIPFKSINIQGLKRSISIDNLKTGIHLLTSMRKAQNMIQDFKPDVVIGTGGYVSAPVLLAASFLSVPTMIHEQNSTAGVTNRLLSRFVTKIGICFEEVTKDFPKSKYKIEMTGNPRGQEVIDTPEDPHILNRKFGLEDNLPTVLVFGGSRGAPAITKAAVDSIPSFSQREYQVIIATGSDHYDQVVEAVEGGDSLRAKNVKIVPYIDNMPSVFRAIDLVVCRSGATTLTEILALGLPSLLIPSPYVTNNHQEKNAQSLVSKKAAMMLLESDLNKDSLTMYIDELMTNPEKLKDMSTRATNMAITDARDRIVSILEEITI